MTISQQAFLRDAMRRLNLTRDVFATRIGVKRRALDTWLLPEGSQEFRAMPEVVQRFVSEIVQNGVLLEKYTQSVQEGPLRERIAVEGKHQLLSVDQFTRESVEDLFRVADMMQPIARRQKVSRVLEGAVLGNLFFEASTRTRVSFGSAFCRLGGSVCDTTGFTFSSMAKGESIYDTSRVMSGYVDAMVIRHPDQGSVAEFARATNIPVVNGGGGPGAGPVGVGGTLLLVVAGAGTFVAAQGGPAGAPCLLTGRVTSGGTPVPARSRRAYSAMPPVDSVTRPWRAASGCMSVTRA